MKKFATSFYLLAALGLAVAANAEDAEMCLDCHEPAEDWQGMSAQEILAEAKKPDNKRHDDHRDLPDETLMAMIAELLKK